MLQEKELELNQIADCFVRYVDNNICNLESEKWTLEEVCIRHSIEYTDTMYTDKLKSILISQCKAILKSEEQFPRNMLRDLSDHFALKYLVEKMEIQPYFQMLRTLNNILQNGIMIISIENEAAWNKIIAIMLDVIKLEYDEFDIEREISQLHVRQHVVGQSARYLIDKGYQINVSNNRLLTKDFGKIGRDIEGKIISLGGVNVAERLFTILSRTFNQKQKRYRIIRNRAAFGNRKVNSQYPFGYLLQLCVKNYVKYNTKNSWLFEERFGELLNLSQSYVSIMDIQDYSIYSNMFFDLEKIVYYLQDNMLYDHTVAFTQWNPDYIPSLLKGLLKKFFDDPSIAATFSFSLNDFINVTKKLLDSTSTYGTKRITRNELYTHFPKMDSKSIDEMLVLMSHKRKTINKSYTLPTDVSDFSKKPLIQMKDDEFVIVNPSFCAFSFYETISNSIRNVYSGFNSEVGYELEKYIMRMMTSKGIDCKTGFYSNDNECDIVIETEDKVVFIEVKMKPLTRKAIAGDGVNLFVDLSRSLIASQKQLGTHELYLLQNGKIALRQDHSLKKSKNKKQVVIEHKNRKIERVSVGFTEYGFITDRQVVAAILETVTIGSVHSDDPKREHELNDLHQAAQVLQKQSEKLMDYKSEYSQNEYFDCAFFTLQQLLMIINDSNSTDSFVENLLTTKYSTMSTNDFYYEYDEWRRIRKMS